MMNPPDTKQKRSQTERFSVLGVMAKFWQPGRVKTRLGATIGMERSARLHQLFVDHLFREMSRSDAEPNEPGQGRAGQQPWVTQWVSSPPECLDAINHHVSQWNRNQDQHEIRVVDQGEGDLGNRMLRWFNLQIGPADQSTQQNLKSDSTFERAILIGADCPLLSRNDMMVAMDKLHHTDAVLGPAADGGYYLVGFRSPLNPQMQRVFNEIEWSQDDVFHVTCQRLKEIGMTVSLLPTQEDVDTEVELNRLRTSLAKNLPSRPQSSKRLSESIDQVMETNPIMEPKHEP